MTDEQSNVVGLPGIAMAFPPMQAEPDTVELLERWLAAAQAGEIVQVVIAAVKRAGGTSSEWAGKASMDMTLAAATGLQVRVSAAWIKEVENS